MIYRFGVFEFDDGPSLLTRAGRTAALEPQPARALALLLAQAGGVVTRDELRAHLWGADTHVDFDRGLAYCIGQLRAALGDTAENPRFVQTLPKRGFKFIAPVTTAALGPGPSRERETDVERPAERLTTGKSTIGVRTLVTIATALLIAAAVAWWGMSRDRAPGRPIVAVAVFDNESGDASYERAVAGLSDVIVERLTALGPGRIGVNGNASVLRRPRAARDLRAVVADTRASFLISGQLQDRDGRLSLLIQLIRLDDGTHVWVQRIARPAGDTLQTLDGDVARLVEEAIRRLVLVPQPRA